jgi:hypothetical protein
MVEAHTVAANLQTVQAVNDMYAYIEAGRRH